MPRLISLSLLLLLAACEPDEANDGTTPPGALEYEGTVHNGYRLDRRVDIVPVDPDRPSSCAYLTDRALRDIEDTIAALDPSIDYGFEASGQACAYIHSPGAQIHLAGFQLSPFSCDELCCHEDLAAIARVYFHVANNLEDTVFEVDGEPYLAIDPEQACP